MPEDIKAALERVRQLNEMLSKIYAEQEHLLTALRRFAEVGYLGETSIQVAQAVRENYGKIQDSIRFLTQLRVLHARVVPSFYSPLVVQEGSLVIERPIQMNSKAEQSDVRLKQCPRGEEGWREFELLCEEILTYVLKPPLLGPFPQDWTEDKSQRRDILFDIPATAQGFWTFLSDKFDCSCILFDCKNSEDELSPEELGHVVLYLSSKSIGRFGIVISRTPLSKRAKVEARRLWDKDGKLLLCIQDAHLLDMVKLREAGEDPSVLLDKLLKEFLRKG